jgi:hypothetical protein
VGENKKVKRGSLCFRNYFLNVAENWQKILNFKWGFAPNCPAVIPPLLSGPKPPSLLPFKD